MSKYLAARFIVLYVALGVVVACSIAGVTAMALYPALSHKVAHVQAQLGDTNLTRLADKYIGQKANDAGLAVTKIVVLHTDQKGDTAKVRARVTLTDGVTTQTVEVVVTFQRGVWSAQGLAVG